VRQLGNQAICHRKINKKAYYIYEINRYEEIISQRFTPDQKCRCKYEAEQRNAKKRINQIIHLRQNDNERQK